MVFRTGVTVPGTGLSALRSSPHLIFLTTKWFKKTKWVLLLSHFAIKETEVWRANVICSNVIHLVGGRSKA